MAALIEESGIIHRSAKNILEVTKKIEWKGELK